MPQLQLNDDKQFHVDGLIVDVRRGTNAKWQPDSLCDPVRITISRSLAQASDLKIHQAAYNSNGGINRLQGRISATFQSGKDFGEWTFSDAYISSYSVRADARNGADIELAVITAGSVTFKCKGETVTISCPAFTRALINAF
jgi:hypothetical protein